MSTEFRMPSLGADMEAGTLVHWLKAPGDRVRRGEGVAVVETQKGAIEVEIFTDGILDRQLVAPGTTVPVGTPLALIRDGGEEPAAPSLPPSAPLRATPGARRLAAARKLDLAGIAGSGPGGAVTEHDVEAAPPVPRRAAPAPPALDLAAMRQAMAAAMARAKREIPHYYLTATLDLGRARAWLGAANQARPPERRLLMAALLVKAAALAVRRSPEMNGAFLDGAFRPGAAIHVGFAVAVRGGGLVAPALHDADKGTLDELMAGLRDVAARARAGTLRSSELADPTITVTSLGDGGAEAVLPIITPPQVAVLGFGRETVRPWVVAGAVAARPTVVAALAGDHRVSDGHRGSRLLAEIDRLLQRPEEL